MAVDAGVVAIKGRGYYMEGGALEKMRETPLVGRNEPICHIHINQNALLAQKPQEMRVLMHLAMAQESELLPGQEKPVAVMGGDKYAVADLL